MKTNFYKIPGQNKDQAEATRAMNARAYVEGRIDAVSEVTAGGVAAAVGMAARRYLTTFVVEAAAAEAAGFTVTAGSAGAIGLTIAAPLVIGLTAGTIAGLGVKKVSCFFLNRGSNSLVKEVQEGLIEPLDAEAAKAAFEDGTVVPVMHASGNPMAKAMDAALAKRAAQQAPADVKATPEAPTEPGAPAA